MDILFDHQAKFNQINHISLLETWQSPIPHMPNNPGFLLPSLIFSLLFSLLFSKLSILNRPQMLPSSKPPFFSLYISSQAISSMPCPWIQLIPTSIGHLAVIHVLVLSLKWQHYLRTGEVKNLGGFLTYRNLSTSFSFIPHYPSTTKSYRFYLLSCSLVSIHHTHLTIITAINPPFFWLIFYLFI